MSTASLSLGGVSGGIGGFLKTPNAEIGRKVGYAAQYLLGLGIKSAVAVVGAAVLAVPAAVVGLYMLGRGALRKITAAKAVQKIAASGMSAHAQKTANKLVKSMDKMPQSAEVVAKYVAKEAQEARDNLAKAEALDKKTNPLKDALVRNALLRRSELDLVAEFGADLVASTDQTVGGALAAASASHPTLPVDAVRKAVDSVQAKMLADAVKDKVVHADEIVKLGEFTKKVGSVLADATSLSEIVDAAAKAAAAGTSVDDAVQTYLAGKLK